VSQGGPNVDLLWSGSFQIVQGNVLPVGIAACQRAERVGQRTWLPYDGCNACGVALFLAVEHPGCRVERRGAIEDDIFIEFVPGHGGRYAVTPSRVAG
jgi:hypothetical protein